MIDKNESNYQDVADLRAENAKLRAELAALKAQPSDAEIEAWRSDALCCFAATWKATDGNRMLDRAVALMRRARSAPAPSALREAAKLVAEMWGSSAPLKPTWSERIEMLKAALAAEPEAQGSDWRQRYEDLLGDLGLHPDTEHDTVRNHIESVRHEARESADAFTRGKQAALKAQTVAVPEDVLARAERTAMAFSNYLNGSGFDAKLCADFILSLPAAAQPAAPQDDELQRLLDDYRRAVEDGAWDGPASRLTIALAQRLGAR